MITLDDHSGADRLRPPFNYPAFFFLQARRQQQVQLFQIPHLWHRHQMIPPELSPFAFYAAFLVPFTRRAELRLVSPVRAESDEPRRLLPLISPQDFLHRTF